MSYLCGIDRQGEFNYNKNITTTYVPRLLCGGQLSFSVVGINPPTETLSG